MTSFWSRAEVATGVAAVVLLQAVVPLPKAVVKNYFRSYPRWYRCSLFRTPKRPQLLQTDSEFDETKFVGKLATRANTILIEISIISKLEKAHKKMVRTLPQIRPVKHPTPKTS